MSAEKKEKGVTPVGEAKWAHVQTPKPAYKDERGQVKGEPKYQIDVIADPKDKGWKTWAADIVARMGKLPVQTDKKTKKPIPHQSPFKKEFDENDKETGRWFITFKTGEKLKPGLFDKYGRPIPEDVLIGNGSKVRVSYTINAYEGFGGGINLYLNAVQVMELVEYKAMTAEACGFKCEQPPEGEESPFQPGDAQEPPPGEGAPASDDQIPY